MAEGPHQYAITWGAPRFRQALVEKQRHWMGLDLDPETNMVVTCGSTEATVRVEATTPLPTSLSVTSITLSQVLM